MRKKISRIFAVSLMLFAFSFPAIAAEQGHYYPGIAGIRDYAVPPKGVYFAMIDAYYAAREFEDGSGNEIDNISISAGQSLTKNIGIRGKALTVSATVNADIDVDLQIDTVLHQPMLIWNTGWQFLGADYAMMISTPFGYQRIDVEADVNATATVSVGGFSQTLAANRSIEIEDNKYGFGDMSVTPVMLGWHGKHYDLTSLYTFIAPTGAYDEGDLANVGFGFWSHWWQQAIYIYPFDIPSTAIMFMGTYELNSYKYEKDVRPGQTVTVEYGISQYLHERFEVGVNGYHQWQVTEDAGEQGVNTGVKDSMNGIGTQMTFWLKKNKLAVVGRFNAEYGVRDRFEGFMSSVNFLWAFGDALSPKSTDPVALNA